MTDPSSQVRSGLFGNSLARNPVCKAMTEHKYMPHNHLLGSDLWDWAGEDRRCKREDICRRHREVHPCAHGWYGILAFLLMLLLQSQLFLVLLAPAPKRSVHNSTESMLLWLSDIFSSLHVCPFSGLSPGNVYPRPDSQMHSGLHIEVSLGLITTCSQHDVRRGLVLNKTLELLRTNTFLPDSDRKLNDR